MAVEARRHNQFGEFHLTSRIGEGPQAVVYQAEKAGQVCALKILKESALPKSAGHRKRLAQVLKNLSKINHPSVVRVLEGGELDGKLYVVMELMQCPTLAQYVAAQQRVSESELALLLRQIGQALEAGRAASFYHGELTADNVFVPAPNRAKVADFAIRKYIHDLPKDSELGEAPKPAAAQESGEEWATAEELLRSRSQGTSKDQQYDLVAMGVLAMKMLGISVPEPKDEEPLGRYCERVRELAYQLRKPPTQVNPLLEDVILRLFSPGAFRSPNEVVVEVASAQVLQRKGRSSSLAAPTEETDISQSPPQPQPAPAEVPVKLPAPAPEPSAPKGEREPATRLIVTPGANPLAAEETPFFVWHGDRRGEFFLLHDGEEIALGRDPDQCQVVIPDGTASRRHCVLAKKGAAIHLTDGGSANGTFVNGRRVQSVELAAGDIIRVGGGKVSVGQPFPEK